MYLWNLRSTATSAICAYSLGQETSCLNPTESYYSRTASNTMRWLGALQSVVVYTVRPQLWSRWRLRCKRYCLSNYRYLLREHRVIVNMTSGALSWGAPSMGALWRDHSNCIRGEHHHPGISFWAKKKQQQNNTHTHTPKKNKKKKTVQALVCIQQTLKFWNCLPCNFRPCTLLLHPH